MRFRSLLLLALFVAGTSLAALAQDTPVPPSALKAFEVASVKLSSPDRAGNLPLLGGASYRATGTPLSILLQLAFGLQDSQISGPGWIRYQAYDIEAKTEGGAVLTEEQMEPLLQRLLAEGLKLTYHFVTEDRPGYALMLSKSGPKMAVAAAGAEGGGNILHNAIVSKGATMPDLASMLEIPLGKPVVDKTGLTGQFVVNLKYATLSDDSDLPSIPAAVQEQLGLKLDTAKVPVKVMIIDHVEKVPTEN